MVFANGLELAFMLMPVFSMQTTKERSGLMRRVRGKNTKPEVRLRKALHAAGMRFRLHDRRLPGRPDTVLPGRRLAIFVHGCFWHRHDGCARTTTPKANNAYWAQKFAENIERDARKAGELRQAGWKVRIAWECEILDEGTLAKVVREVAASPKIPHRG
jgi:DNA mismatch endonuclease, patch repair protein